MNIVIFGATGGTGQELVKQTVAAGHTVTAFVRNPKRVEHPAMEHLKLVVGDVLDEQSVSEAIAGQDIVLSALGTRTGEEVGVVRSEGTKHIVASMKQHGVKRLIAVSTIGIRDTTERMSRFMHFMLKLIIGKERLAEATKQEEIISATPLAWTLVRPPRLVDKSRSGNYEADPLLKTKMSNQLSRADLADFMLKQIKSTQLIRQYVTVVN